MAERKKGRVPAFTTYREEAEFWDSHSLAEFSDELQEVNDVRVTQPLAHHLSVQLDANSLAELTDVASRNGMGPSALAKRWLVQRLEQERDRDRQTPRPEPQASRRSST